MVPALFNFSLTAAPNKLIYLSCVAKAEVCVDSLIPGLEAPQSQHQPDLSSSGVQDRLTGDGSFLGCDLLSHSPAHRTQALVHPGSNQASADSSLLLSCGQQVNNDEFDPIPVLISKNPSQGGHSRSNSGASESSLPNLARSLLLVDQLIDL